jgi:hypothetical protein
MSFMVDRQATAVRDGPCAGALRRRCRAAQSLRATGSLARPGAAWALLWCSDMKQIADALELLTAQHDEIAAKLEAIAMTKPGQLARALGELVDLVTTHLAVEEQFLATLGMCVPAAEHEALRAALTEMLALDVSSSALRAQLDAFAAQWREHADSQEHSMFIALAELLPPDVLEAIGRQLGAWSAQSRCLAA